MRTTWI